MISNLRITVLVENTVYNPDLLAEHGLAYWIEADGCPILFDTGQGGVLPHNAKQLGIDLKTAEKVLLSHGHFDHTGGLDYVLDAGGRPEVYMHPAALAAKFSKRTPPPARDIGIVGLDEKSIAARAEKIVWTSKPTAVVPGVNLTGEVPRNNDFEDTGGPFFLDPECTRPDPLADDQSLFIETPAGLVVVLGCAHSGTVNTLDYISELSGGRKIHALLGGMHLVRANTQRIEATADALDRYAIEKVAPIHCTGVGATAYLRNRLADRCLQCSAGSAFTFGDD